MSASELIVSEGAPNRLGTFLLRRADKIIASVVVDEKTEEGSCAAIISAAETHPDYQRRGTFWRWLGIPLIRVLCESHFDRLEAQTWVLNRKGISVYERFGFRRVPGEGVRMINLLPTLVRSPGLRRHLAGVDWLRDLQWRRGPMGPAGPDSVCYEWRRRSSHSSVVAVVVKAAEW